jgi:hypothetical protein
MEISALFWVLEPFEFCPERALLARLAYMHRLLTPRDMQLWQGCWLSHRKLWGSISLFPPFLFHTIRNITERPLHTCAYNMTHRKVVPDCVLYCWVVGKPNWESGCKLVHRSSIQQRYFNDPLRLYIDHGRLDAKH